MDVISKLILTSPVINSLKCNSASGVWDSFVHLWTIWTFATTTQLNTKATLMILYRYVEYLALQGISESRNRDGVFTFCHAMFKAGCCVWFGSK